MMFDAATLARGWLSVALASGKDADRPHLDRTVHVEEHARLTVRGRPSDAGVDDVELTTLPGAWATRSAADLRDAARLLNAGADWLDSRDAACAARDQLALDIGEHL
jgi:hypothetical protein